MNAEFTIFKSCRAVLLVVLSASCSGALQAATLTPAGATSFVVVNNAFEDWSIDGQFDPALQLIRGLTYTFDLQAVPNFHPFFIKTASSTGSGNQFSNGVTGNGATVDGDVIFTVPANAPSQLFYNCGNHAAMAGVINIVDEPALFVNGFED